jgi:hypothetical protein
MSQIINASTSFVQGQKHETKSDRFQAIRPAMIAEVLDGHGFDLVHLKTGRAKSQDRQDFQTTVARYRSRDGFGVDGSSFDLIFKVPHLYGSLQGVLGLFRGTCANQLNVGKWFDSIRVKHVGNPYQELDRLIPELVAQRESLVETVKMMQSRDVTPSELVQLAQRIAEIRLQDCQNVTKVEIADLLKVRRQDDAKNDLFSCLNVIQENVLRFGLRYQINSTDQNGVQTIRNATARRVGPETVKAIDLNASIWDAATELLKAA